MNIWTFLQEKQWCSVLWKWPLISKAKLCRELNCWLISKRNILFVSWNNDGISKLTCMTVRMSGRSDMYILFWSQEDHQSGLCDIYTKLLRRSLQRFTYLSRFVGSCPRAEALKHTVYLYGVRAPRAPRYCNYDICVCCPQWNKRQQSRSLLANFQLSFS